MAEKPFHFNVINQTELPLSPAHRVSDFFRRNSDLHRSCRCYILRLCHNARTVFRFLEEAPLP